QKILLFGAFFCYCHQQHTSFRRNNTIGFKALLGFKKSLQDTRRKIFLQKWSVFFAQKQVSLQSEN
ncbi:MAG TPA: hypothetical protein PKH93_09500, partial [Chitinophagales bacterium]|nr:hypothetical protein [Chitinophagales bacterium]